MKTFLFSFLMVSAIAQSASSAQLEHIMGFSPRGRGLIFQVHSGGCTHKEQFKLNVEKNEQGPSQVTLYRLSQDPCKAFLPTGTTILFTLEELGLRPGESYYVTNPHGVVTSWIWNDEDTTPEETK